MVGWLHWGRETRFFPRLSPACPLGYPLLEVALPPGEPDRRLAQGARLLHRRGIRRVVAGPGLDDGPRLTGRGLVPVAPAPLCRALGARLALVFLEPIPIRERRVALRGELADAQAWALARTLCPRVGAILLDFDKGEETLARRLRGDYGAVPLRLGWGEPPQVVLELSPRPLRTAGKTLRLWGEPDLGGLEPAAPEELPPDLPQLPFLNLLWEAGRLRPEEVVLRRSAVDP